MRAILIPSSGSKYEARTVSNLTVHRARGFCAESIVLLDQVRTESDRDTFAIINECLSWKKVKR